MSKLLAERKLSLNKLAQREDINISTVWRWVQRGVRGVRLESYSAGGRRCTTDEAYGRFCEAITAITVGEQAAPLAARTNRQVEARISAAESDLRHAGA